MGTSRSGRGRGSFSGSIATTAASARCWFMSAGDRSPAEAEFLDRLGRLGPALLGAIAGIEMARRQLHPPRIAELRAALAPARDALGEAVTGFESAPAPEGLTDLAEQLRRAAGSALQSLDLFVEPGQGGEGVSRIMAAMHHHCRAQHELF